MEYNLRHFDNYGELKDVYPKLAEVLLEEFGEGEWMENALEVFPTLEDFSKYELTDGWYFESFKNEYKGAPDPLDFINLKSFGEALMSSWNDSIYFKYEGFVVSTSYGW